MLMGIFSMGMLLIPVSCTMSQTSVHSSSRPLSITDTNYQVVVAKLEGVVMGMDKIGEED